MGWYFRKSVGFGPFRVNLSKSGVGYSFGVRGARIGVDSRGTYIRMGRSGIYYQKYLQAKSPADPSQPLLPSKPDPAPDAELADVVRTASVASLQDSSATELLQEITLHYQKERIAPLVLILAIAAVGASILVHFPIWAEIAFVLAGAAAHVFAIRADYKRKVVHLDYSLEPEATRAYLALLQGIDALRSLGGLWRISSGQVNADTKYHAGAGYPIKRNKIDTKFDPRSLLALMRPF